MRNEDLSINCYLLRLYYGDFLRFIILFHNLNAICNANKERKKKMILMPKDFPTDCEFHSNGIYIME